MHALLPLAIHPTVALAYRTQSPELTSGFTRCNTLCGIRRMYYITTYIRHYNYHTEYFSLPKDPLCSTCPPSLPLITGNQCSSYCLYSFTFSRMSCRWDHTVHYLFILASLAQYNAFNVFSYFFMA